MIEFVIWMPVFANLLAIIMNLSMMFYRESQMLRVSQDATRVYSMGRFVEVQDGPTAAEQAEAYVQSRLSFIDATLDVQVSTVNDPTSGALAQTVVSANAASLMPFSILRKLFETVDVGVLSRYIIEY